MRRFSRSAEVMLVNQKATQPLTSAAYENHHTRELKADANAYLADKAQDISDAVRIWRKHFPEFSVVFINSLFKSFHYRSRRSLGQQWQRGSNCIPELPCTYRL